MPTDVDVGASRERLSLTRLAFASVEVEGPEAM